MRTAAAAPLGWQALNVAGRAQGRRAAAAEPPPVGPAPALPDKANFPHLRGVYLNGAATHPRPAGASELIRRAAAGEVGDADGFRPDSRRILANFARLIHTEPENLVFVPSTQAGESLVASALGLPERGAHVVSDYLHFCGSQEMYTDMQRRGLEVSWVKMSPEGRIPLDQLDRALVKGKTKLVAVSSTAFVNGFQHDIPKVAEAAHAKGALVYVDFIQSAGNEPVDVTAWGVDAACSGTYKWLMSPGTALLYVSPAAIARMQPPVYHWTRYTRMLPTTHMYPFDTPGREIVDRYEPKSGPAGLFSMGYEPNDAALAGLEYSLPYILSIGPAKIQAYVQTLTDRLKQELPQRGYRLLTPPEARSPLVTVVAENAQQYAPAFRAAEVTLTTRWNHIRMSPSLFNDMDDIERALAAMPRRG